MYISIRRYQTDPGVVKELMLKINETFVPIISNAPGFVAYYGVNAGGGVLTFVSIFEDQAGTEASNRMASDWIKQHGLLLFPNPPEITAGEVMVGKTT
ncbi:MAG: hypothetical protein V3V70_01495 [Candidatus Scalindua sp.]